MYVYSFPFYTNDPLIPEPSVTFLVLISTGNDDRKELQTPTHTGWFTSLLIFYNIFFIILSSNIISSILNPLTLTSNS